MKDILEDLNNNISAARFYAHQIKKNCIVPMPLEQPEDDSLEQCLVEFDENGFVCWTWPDLYED